MSQCNDRSKDWISNCPYCGIKSVIWNPIFKYFHCTSCNKNIENIHKHKVYESHLRTALKGVTAKALEVFFDFIALNLLFHRPVESLGAAIGLEALCYGLNYLNERGWNHVMWGRTIIEVEK